MNLSFLGLRPKLLLSALWAVVKMNIYFQMFSFSAQWAIIVLYICFLALIVYFFG
jgi:hypothetical protein